MASITSDRSQSPNEDPSVRVVDRVAAVREADPLDLPPLYGTVDPDALDALLSNAAPTARVDFDFAGCEVVVRGDGSVDVTPPAERDVSPKASATAEEVDESSGTAMD